MRRLCGATAVVGLVLFSAAAVCWAGDAVQFNRDIRPILAENCFACHGPDAGSRKAKLRLDRREDAVASHEGGTPILPGQPDQSEILSRIASTDPEKVMPPPKTGKSVSTEQVQTLRRWIAQGAPWQKHWAFIPPVRPDVPAVKDVNWCRNEIDRFVLAKLESHGMHPSSPADPHTLIRRLSLDLTGTPPTPGEVDAFMADHGDAAYAALVDRLLASPHFGERLGLLWLDAARYADTNGYNNDADRTMWPWRDWVISAFNTNLPYDQFLTDQIAGDLLPGATLDQKIATGFNRNHHITTEGGAVDEEYRVEYVFDRVETTSTAFMGLTMRCARCHDHKYDPIAQKDYYSFFAYFNNVPEQGVPAYGTNVTAFPPAVAAPTVAQQNELKELTAQRSRIDALISERVALADAALPAWERSLPSIPATAPTTAPTTAPFVASTTAPSTGLSASLLLHLKLDETSGSTVSDAGGTRTIGNVVGPATWAVGRFGNALSFDGQSAVEIKPAFTLDRTDAFTLSAWIKPHLGQPMAVLSKMDDADGNRGFDCIVLSDGRIEAHVIHHYPDNALKVSTRKPMSGDTWHSIVVTHDGSAKAAGSHVYVDGVSQELNVEADVLHDTIQTAQPLRIGRRSTSLPFHGLIDDVRIYRGALGPADVAKLSTGTDPVGLAELLRIPAEHRTDAQRAQLRQLYLDSADKEYASLKHQLADIATRTSQLNGQVVQTMVMEEMPAPRPAHVLHRGEYDKPGDAVTAAAPAWLAPLPAGAPANRLGLARWMTDPTNPLVARVAVNRLWQFAMGAGLVETSEDFGTQGEPPAQPELLDWLATRFIRSGWDTKAMLRLIVTSSTYRQSSEENEQALAQDPRNRLLGRAARFRLPAETIRDNALAISGLLQDKVGGPSVFPYQPGGLWEEVSVEHRAHYPQSHGPDLYRRSLYSFMKRTSPPPALVTADATDRETCVVRRARTDTPLQALILMNDPTYVEASRKLAERMMTEAPAAPAARLELGCKLALARGPSEREQSVLLSLLDSSLHRFGSQPDEAKKLLSVGESPRRHELNEPELAAWTTVAGSILSLDETINRE